MNDINAIVKTLKPGDMLIGSSVWAPQRNNDIDIYSTNEENWQYYKDLGYDVVNTHPSKFMFSIQCVGIDHNGETHYFHKDAKTCIEERMLYINENAKNFNPPNLVKYLALWPQYGFSRQVLNEIGKSIHTHVWEWLEEKR